jgi:hypothetical protein
VRLINSVRLKSLKEYCLCPLLFRGGSGNNHPVWLVNRVDIPQKGSYTHFHWITTGSTDPRAVTVPWQCDVKTAGELENNAEDIVCPGWFLEIKADDKFAFEHGNEVVPVRKGIDNATHLNLVTNYKADLEIDPTRPCYGLLRLPEKEVPEGCDFQDGPISS